MRNEIGPFFFWQNSWIKPNRQKWPKFINYNGLATMSHGYKGYFPLCNHDLWLERGEFYGIFQLNSYFLWTFRRSGVKNAIFMGKSHEISLFATASHSCKGKNILCNCDRRLRRGKYLFIFRKMSWLLKTCIYLWCWQSRIPES